MKVRTRLHISALLPALLAVVVSVILFGLTGLYKGVAASVRASNNVVGAAFRLDAATHRYARSVSPENERKWRDAYEEVARVLASEKALNERDMAVLAGVAGAHKELLGLFELLVGFTVERPDGAQTVSPLSTGAGQADVLDEMSRKLLSMVSGAMTVAANGQDEALLIQQRAYLSIVVVCVLLAVLLGISALLLSRSVADGVTALHEGTARVRRGDMDESVAVDSADELRDLAEAFNAMMTACRESRNSLLSSNQQLSEALVRVRRAQGEVIQEERLRVLRQMARGIIHDINDALMPIQGIAELLLHVPGQADDKELLMSHIGAIHDACRRASATVRHLSDYFKPTKHAEVLEEVDIQALVGKVVDGTMPFWREERAAKGIEVKVRNELPSLPRVVTDVTDIEEALVAVLLNAIEALPSGGTVTVKGGLDEEIVWLEVLDNGVGMRPEVRNRCLEPFYSTKGPDHSGMGLTVVADILKKLGGSMAIESALDSGTKVRISLPRERKIMRSVVEDTGKADPVHLHVLVADDEAWVRDVLKTALVAMGHEVDVVNDGAEALEAFGRGRYGLLVLDRAMPAMSGDEVASRIRAMPSDVPIVMLTGFGDLMRDSGERPAGVDVVLSKPIGFDDLKRGVEAALRRGKKS